MLILKLISLAFVLVHGIQCLLICVIAFTMKVLQELMVSPAFLAVLFTKYKLKYKTLFSYLCFGCSCICLFENVLTPFLQDFFSLAELHKKLLLWFFKSILNPIEICINLNIKSLQLKFWEFVNEVQAKLFFGN